MLRIGIVMYGGIGDIITYSRAVHQFVELVGQPVTLISQHTKNGNLQKLFATATYVEAMLDITDIQAAEYINFDLLMLVRHQVTYRLHQPQLVMEQLPQLSPFFETASYYEQRLKIMAEDQPKLDRLFADYTVLQGYNRNQFIMQTAGFDPNIWEPLVYVDPVDAQILPRLGLTPQNYLTIHDGWDTNFQLQQGKKPTKCWPDRHWQELIHSIKQRYPEMPVVQLGSSNSTQYAGVDYQLVGQTNLGEVAWMLKHSRQHIDTESGLVHLAYAMGHKSICLTGPTNAAYYNYPANHNLVAQNCQNCAWITPDWIHTCLLDAPEPICMANLTPDMVMAQLIQNIDL